MQHQRCADTRAQVLRVARDRQQHLCSHVEHQPVDQGLVLIRDGADLRRQGEHHMIIGDWQQLGFARREPLGGGSSLAFGTMPVATGIVGNARVGTILAALDMTAERGGTAGLDRRHDA